MKSKSTIDLNANEMSKIIAALFKVLPERFLNFCRIKRPTTNYRGKCTKLAKLLAFKKWHEYPTIHTIKKLRFHYRNKQTIMTKILDINIIKSTYSFPLFCFLFSFGGTRLWFVVFTTVFFTFTDALIMTLIWIAPTTALLYLCKFMDRI